MTAEEIKNDYRLLVIGEVIKWETTGEEELGNKRRSFFFPFWINLVGNAIQRYISSKS